MPLLRAGMRLSQDHAMDPEHSGRRAEDLSGCRVRAGGHRVAPQFRPKPDRRDLGAGALIYLPSFRGDAKRRTRNLEIPRCAIAHLRFALNARPGMTITPKPPSSSGGADVRPAAA